jgi:hypothetical protein
MRIRYFSYLALAVAAAFLVVATWAFSLPTVTALALGMGVAMLAVSLELIARYHHDTPSIAIGALIAAASGWLVVASQVFSGTVALDLTRALALAVGALAVVGLTFHELATERVVHRLEVHQGSGGQSHTPDPRAA